MQIEAGVEGISPGPSTENFLRRTMNIMRFWGALLVAVLASAAHAFDHQCMQILGTNVSSVSLLLVVGFVTSVIRQVSHSTFCAFDHASMLLIMCACFWSCIHANLEHKCKLCQSAIGGWGCHICHQTGQLSN